MEISLIRYLWLENSDKIPSWLITANNFKGYTSAHLKYSGSIGKNVKRNVGFRLVLKHRKTLYEMITNSQSAFLCYI